MINGYDVIYKNNLYLITIKLFFYSLKDDIFN